MINIYDEFKKFNYKFDRTTQVLQKLPYSFEEIKIKGNSYVADYNYNDSIKKLYENYMFLYSCCTIANFKMYDTFLYNISSNGTTYTNILTESNNQEFNSLNFLLSSSITGCTLNKTSSTNYSVIILATSDTILGLKTSENSTVQLFKNNSVEPLSGDIMFRGINYIRSYSDNSLYVFDSFYKNIYYYSVNGIIEGENIFNNLNLINFIGGNGEVDDKEKFKDVHRFAVNSSIVVVQDFGNFCFKIYDKSLNWINTVVFRNIFKEVIKFDAIILDSKNNLYCGKGDKIYKFNYTEKKDYIFVGKYELNNYFKDESIIDFSNSFKDKDIFYILTDKSVKKVWFTQLQFVIGSVFTNPNLDNKWLSVASHNENLDSIVMYSKKNNKDLLSLNLDSVFLDTILEDSNFNIYEFDECLIKSTEYVNSFVLMKNMQKIFINCFNLLKNIKYRYFEDKDKLGYIFEKRYNKGFLGYTDKIDLGDNFNIGVNEIFQSEVLNRCFKELFDFQIILLLYVINNENNVEYLSPDPSAGSELVKNFIYFADESIILSQNPVKLDIFGVLSPNGGLLTSLGGAPYEGIGGISITEGVNI